MCFRHAHNKLATAMEEFNIPDLKDFQQWLVEQDEQKVSASESQEFHDMNERVIHEILKDELLKSPEDQMLSAAFRGETQTVEALLDKNIDISVVTRMPTRTRC